MYFYILFLKSGTIYYVEVHEHDFYNLIDDLSIEYQIDKHYEDNYSFHCCTYYYFDKKGKRKEIGYAASVKNEKFISRLQR